MRMSGRDQFKRFRGVINIISLSLSLLGRPLNMFFLRCIRNVNGKIGLVLRYILVKNLVRRIGDNVSIQPGVFFFNLDKLILGSNISIHPMCYIDAAGGVEIGDNVSIAHCSTIISASHTWNDLSIPIKYNPEILLPVVLENDIWVGCGVRILAGVTIKERSIVAAGSVVNKSVDSNSIVGGVPAKLLKMTNE